MSKQLQGFTAPFNQAVLYDIIYLVCIAYYTNNFWMTSEEPFLRETFWQFDSLLMVANITTALSNWQCQWHSPQICIDVLIDLSAFKIAITS